MLIEPELTRRPRNDRQVIALFDSVLPQQRQYSLQHLGATKFLFDRQQPNFTDVASGRQIGVDILEFLVQGERPRAAHRQHPRQLVSAHADQVGVFGMKLVNQPMSG